MYRYFKKIGNTERISSWKSKGLSDDCLINPLTTSDNSLAPVLSHFGNKTKVTFDGCCLKQGKITVTYGKIVNVSIVYESQLVNMMITQF